MRDIVIACVNAADQTLKELIGTDGIVGGVHQTRLIRNVEGELSFLFNDDYVAVSRVYRDSDQIDQLFGLAGPLQPHDNLNQD